MIEHIHTVAVVPLMMTFDGRATEMGFQALVAVGKRPYSETILTSDRSDYIPHDKEDAPISQHCTVVGVSEGLAILAIGILKSLNREKEFSSNVSRTEKTLRNTKK